jgi:hypothetical protein
MRVEVLRLTFKVAQPFQYRNKGNLATVGRSYAIVDIGKQIRKPGGFCDVQRFVLLG